MAVILDFSRHLNRILTIDAARRQARVQPGVVLDRLRDEAERVGLTFGPDPATHRWCTLGGMIGNNSCGVHSVMSGKTDDNIDELDVLTYDGLRMRVGATTPALLEAHRPRRRSDWRDLRGARADTRPLRAISCARSFPRIPRRVSGFNLDFLLPENGFNVARALVGTEGTCVTILEATAQARAQPAVPRRCSCSDSATSTSRPTPSRKSRRLVRSGSRASTNCWCGIRARRASTPSGLALLPRRAGLAVCRVWRRTPWPRRRRRRPGSWIAAREPSRRADDAPVP
ncbi:MAG: FAD-dependent oxidoreductase [Comamonadaceae bacterium]|nr:FAD-dependent oxidoreductase [Comamonadaceae bacterium]